MRKLSFIIICLISCPWVAMGQTASLYPLHEYVGDTIEIQEKKAFYLFDEIPDGLYAFAYVEKANNQFTLVAHFVTDSIHKQPMDEQTIATYRQKIEKFGNFYKQRGIEIKGNKLFMPNSASDSTLQMRINDPRMQKHMDGNLEQLKWMQDSKERQKLREQGFIVPDARVEFQLNKKKKKKQ